MTKQDVLDLLDFDPESGVFKWKARRSTTAKAGMTAGCADSSGHRQIKLKGRAYSAHHLAWFVFYGVWPTKQLDHQDGNRDNNAVSNLREATNAQNQQNAKLKKRNSSGFKGVTSHGGLWRSRITVERRQIYLGKFHDPCIAAAIYDMAAMQYFGSFARTNGDVVTLIDA